MNNKLEVSKNIPILYLYIYKKLYDSSPGRLDISYGLLTSVFKKILYFIPNKYYKLIIDELVDYGFIEQTEKVKSPIYVLNKKDYEKFIKRFDKIKTSRPGNKLKMLKKDFEGVLKIMENNNYNYHEKYSLLEKDYEKLLNKIEIKKLEGYHYW